MSATTRVLWGIAGLLAVALIAAALYRGWPILFPEVMQTAPLDPACDLRAGPCRARFPDGGTVRLGIEPRSIPVVEPLQLSVQVEGIDASAVEVDFAGTDMEMGFNRVRLLPAPPPPRGGDVFVGQAMLPICVRSRMEWEAKVMLTTPQGLWVAPFRFETFRR